jgi:hypothetical protein
VEGERGPKERDISEKHRKRRIAQISTPEHPAPIQQGELECSVELGLMTMNEKGDINEGSMKKQGEELVGDKKRETRAREGIVPERKTITGKMKNKRKRELM